MTPSLGFLIGGILIALWLAGSMEVTAFETILDDTADFDNTPITDESGVSIGTQPSVRGMFELSGISVSVNRNSLLNPDNRWLQIPESALVLESRIAFSDFPDDDRFWRWLIKARGSRSFVAETTEAKPDQRFFLDEAFIDWKRDAWFINIGKRRINWGAAMAFNPLNVLVPARDPLQPSQETEGQPMILVGYTGSCFNLDLVYTRDFDRNWHSTLNRLGAKLGVSVFDNELKLYVLEEEPDDDETSAIRMRGMSYSANFLDNAVIYGETALFLENDRQYFSPAGKVMTKCDPVYKTAVGSLYTFSPVSSALVEFYHNSGGYTVDERKRYYDILAKYQNDTVSETILNLIAASKFSEMNQTYLLLGYHRTGLLEKFSCSARGILAEDRSMSLHLETGYDVSDFYRIESSLANVLGLRDSEFGNNPTRKVITLSINGFF